LRQSQKIRPRHGTAWLAVHYRLVTHRDPLPSKAVGDTIPKGLRPTQGGGGLFTYVAVAVEQATPDFREAGRISVV
jgi:hypothetical protein